MVNVRLRILSMERAFADPQIGCYVAEMVMMARAAAFDGVKTGNSACFCCGQQWARERYPWSVVWVAPVNERTGALLAAACNECAVRYGAGAGLEAPIRAVLSEHMGLHAMDAAHVDRSGNGKRWMN